MDGTAVLPSSQHALRVSTIIWAHDGVRGLTEDHWRHQSLPTKHFRWYLWLWLYVLISLPQRFLFKGTTEMIGSAGSLGLMVEILLTP
jgi:hypothetical protein